MTCPRPRLIAIVIAFVIFLIAAAVVMFMRTPARYKPAQPENSEKVSPYLTHYLAPDIYNKVQLDDPFKLIVTEEGLNDIIARNIWPQKVSGVSFYGPAVAFDNGTIYLMGKVNYGRLPVVMTIIAAPRLGASGKLQLNIDTVMAGIVDITPFAKTLAERVLADQIKYAGEDSWLAELSDALIKNTPIEPVFEVSAHKKHLRLTAVKIQENMLTLTLKPE